jgi:hypothetical protein
VPTATRTPWSTPTATAVPPTATPVPPTPTATAVPIPCNQFEFVDDITVRDGTILPPGAGFTKIWRLKNTGACTWTSAYSLVFLSGDALQAAAAYALPGNVIPGQVIDLSVPMVAPTQAGSYRGYWQMRDAGGILFGGQQQDTFYVDIQVETPDKTYPYDFVSNYCLAEWTTGAGRIPCQGDSGDSRGVVRRVDNPVLENGYQDDEPLLLTQPQMITDGIIRGKYPAVRVEAGYSFAAIIGCANKSDGCDVNFQLDYQIGDGSIQTLGSWHEVYDETFHRIEVDLSPLAGNDVKFILTVMANGSSNQDKAEWLAPRIIKK